MIEPSRRPVALVNPAAGQGRGARVFRELQAVLAPVLPGLEVVTTTGHGAAGEVARRFVDEERDLVLVVGGDGTVSEVVDGLMASDGPRPRPRPRLLLVPTGRGCDLARGLGLGRSPADVVRALAGPARPVDAVRLDYLEGDRPPRHYVNIADAGLGGLVARYAVGTVVSSTLTYFLATLRGLWTRSRWPMRLEWEGGTMEGDYLVVALANGSYFGAGMHIAPGADPTDGLLDVVALEGVDLVRVWSLALPLYRGSLLGHPRVRHFRCRWVRVSSPDETPMEIDGECAPGLPVRAEVLPGALRVHGVA